jgi:Holliday junction resolvase RusA-like endonuclease
VTNAKTAIDQLSRDYYQKTGIDEDLWMTFSRVNPMKFYGLRGVADNYEKGLREAFNKNETLSDDEKNTSLTDIIKNIKIIKDSDI